MDPLGPRMRRIRDSNTDVRASGAGVAVSREREEPCAPCYVGCCMRYPMESAARSTS